MNIYTTDEEQVEAIKNWWEENKNYVFIFIIVTIVALFATKMWRNSQAVAKDTASSSYTAMMAAIDKKDTQTAKNHAHTLINDYPRFIYAPMAALVLAKIAYQEKQYPQAEKHLQWVVENGKQEELVNIARLRLAKLQLANNAYQKALQLLSDIDESDKFAPMYIELRGDIYIAMQEQEKAIASFDKALLLYQGLQLDTKLLEMKRNNLGKPLLGETLVLQNNLSHASSIDGTTKAKLLQQNISHGNSVDDNVIGR